MRNLKFLLSFIYFAFFSHFLLLFPSWFFFSFIYFFLIELFQNLASILKYSFQETFFSFINLFFLFMIIFAFIHFFHINFLYPFIPYFSFSLFFWLQHHSLFSLPASSFFSTLLDFFNFHSLLPIYFENHHIIQLFSLDYLFFFLPDLFFFFFLLFTLIFLFSNKSFYLDFYTFHTSKYFICTYFVFFLNIIFLFYNPLTNYNCDSYYSLSDNRNWRQIFLLSITGDKNLGHIKNIFKTWLP